MTATLFCKTSIQTAITPTNIREAVQELTRIDKAALVAVGLKRPITSGQGLAMDAGRRTQQYAEADPSVPEAPASQASQDQSNANSAAGGGA